MILREQFGNWIATLTNSEEPAADIVAFNFGLFESENGYTVYVIGAKTFDDEDPDWASEVDFEPEEKYLHINSEETEGLQWDEVLEKVKAIIQEFVSSEKFSTSFMKHAEAITAGFDDGDLIRIK